MIINNKLDRSFGSGGLFSGLVLILIGLVTIQYIWTSFLVVFGCFIAFTRSGTQIKVQERKIRLYQNIFGIFKIGKWKNLEDFRGLTIVPVKKIISLNSYSNRTTDIEEGDYRIFLVNKLRKPEFPINKYSTRAEALNAINELSLSLELSVYSVPVKKDRKKDYGIRKR